MHLMVARVVRQLMIVRILIVIHDDLAQDHRILQQTGHKLPPFGQKNSPTQFSSVISLHAWTNRSTSSFVL